MNDVLDRTLAKNTISKAIENLIVEIAKSKYFWLDESSSNRFRSKVHFKNQIDYIKISFNNCSSEMISRMSFKFCDGLTEKLEPLRIVNDNSTSCFYFDHYLGDFQINISHTFNVWEAWKCFGFRISVKYVDDALPACDLYDSDSIYNHVGGLISSLGMLGADSDAISYLSGLLDSIYFKASWDNSLGKDIYLFDIVSKLIHPYTVGAHGYTLPLQSQGIERNVSSLDNIVAKLDSIGLPWFATSGTLLGFVRDSSFIPYDDDLDFAICIGTADDSQELANLLECFVKENEKTLVRTDNPLHYKMAGDVGAVDVFVAWNDSNGRAHVYPWCFKDLEATDLYKIKKIFVFDKLMNIPRNAEVCLKLNYGENWRKPDPLWRFNWDLSGVRFSDYLGIILE
jgi:hypothetical protein